MSLNKFTIQKSFAISAGAGSGKTYTLSRRYINALLGFDYFREAYASQESYFAQCHTKNAKVNQIVTLTYTEAAALEMKGRIFELVSKIIDPNLDTQDGDYSSIKEANENISSEERAYVQQTLKQAFQDSSNAKISTIHAYCLDIIKANADIARIDTKLDIIKDDEKAKVLSGIIFEVLNDAGNKEIVLDISKDISMFFINGLIDKYVNSSKFRKDYDSFDIHTIDVNTYKALILELYPLPEIAPEIYDEIDHAKDHEIRSEWFGTYVENFMNFDAKSWKSFAIVSIIKSGKNKGKEKISGLGLGAVKFPELDAFVKEMDKLVQFYALIDAVLEDHFFDKIAKIKILLHKIKEKYDKKLDILGKIDFDTIITKTLEIIPKVKTDFKYIMVDEFQDTNVTQFDIIRNSMNPETNLFVVGDSKQSIYAFQGAEIEVFNNAVQDRELFGSIEEMSTNYRSDGQVLEPINEIFEVLLKKNENEQLISQNYEAQAQALNVSSVKKESQGSFRYLITSQEYLDTETKKEMIKQGEYRDEMDTIAQFIEEICQGKRDAYHAISQRIEKKEKAIAILFDGGEKMLTLHKKLKERGISAKISKSDNFYHTKEINDVFNVLKAIEIISKEPEKFTDAQKYYLAGAMRSNILRVDENRIYDYLEKNKVDDTLLHYADVFKTLILSQAVKYIYDASNIMGVYAHLDAVEQRKANLYKFLTLCKEHEEGGKSDIYTFLALIEDAIYFSKEKEDEAFFQSENTRSIELCTIHSTKGLAYPLIILANADKGLYGAITSDALKHNNFEIKGTRKEIVGFKINNYVPLSHRVLKQIDKLKHLAEKKRLFYVALTRAEHDVVISAELKPTKNGIISLREDSYLHMICESLEIDKEELYGQNKKYCIPIEENDEIRRSKAQVNYVDHIWDPIAFESKKSLSATGTKENDDEDKINTEAAKIGTITHKIIELYWNNFTEHQEAILDKMGVLDAKQRDAIAHSMKRFYKSDVYTILQNGSEHHFELEFNDDGKIGFIDFIYFDTVREGWVIVDFKTGSESEGKNSKYQKQLDFYQTVMETLGYKIVESRLLWL